MTRREDLKAVFALAEAARKKLEAALAKAEAGLANAVINSTKVGVGWVEANASLDKARADCRQVRAALVKLELSELKALSAEQIDAQIEQLCEVSKQGATANPPSIQSSEQAVRGESKRSQDESMQRKPIHRFSNARARSPLLRQTIGLLALTLAYLQYYFFDVQLQILSLPSITALLLQ